MLGCTVFSEWNSYDGSYPGLIQPNSDNITAGIDYPYQPYCTAVHGFSGGRTIGNKQCCKSPSYDFNCVVRYSEESTGNGPSYAAVTCDTGYVMTGCSGWSLFPDLNGHWIDSNTCWARSYSTYSVYAIAICCKLETESPTKHPSPAPSEQPTDSPTIEPSLEPTISPSFSPSGAPLSPVKHYAVCIPMQVFVRNSNILNLFSQQIHPQAWNLHSTPYHQFRYNLSV